MAYEQGNYQAPSRPYNGRAAAPPQQYNQQHPAQGYGGQGQYDQYPQDNGGGYVADGYDNGYGQQDYGYQQPPMNGGGGGGRGGGGAGARGGYPPQQQSQYGNGGPQYGQGPRGGGGQGGRGADPYGGRPPPQDGPLRGGQGGPPPGRGGRPVPLQRSATSDPGGVPRPLANLPMSPQEVGQDGAFPGFPGARKKTSISEEQKIIQDMSQMELTDGGRPRTAGSNRAPQGGGRRPPPGGPNGHGGRPPVEGQRGPPPRGPPGQYQGGQPGYGGHRPPPPGQGYRGQTPPQNQYGGPQGGYGAPPQEDFGPPSRANTMPYDSGPPQQQGGPRYPVGDVGPSAPYNGPAGRMPPRPSTTTGVRPVPQRQYPSDTAQRQQPPQQLPQQLPQQQYNNPSSSSKPFVPGHGRGASISDVYQDYFDDGTGQGPTNAQPAFDDRQQDWDAQRRGPSMDGYDASGQMPPRQAVNGNSAMGQMQTPADSRAQVQPQSAVYEMVGDAPPVPQGNFQQGYDQQYDQYNGQRQQQQQTGPPIGGGYDAYNQGQQQNYGPPPAPPPTRGLPNGPAPRGNGPLPIRMNSLPQQPSPDNGMPSHPPPVRAGLVPNSVANMASNKPPPVRNYGNVNSPAPQIPPPQQQQAQQAPPASVEEHKPVTSDELERLKAICKVTPNDHAALLTLARKFIEATEVLVPTLPDARQRAKQRERYILDAHKMLKKLSSGANPYPEAQFFLADCYGRGALALEPDNKEAFTLYQSAAKAGHAAAAYRTAVCCELGNDEGGGTRKDPLKAMQWYKRAATLGDTPAMYKMGIISLKGLLGQPKNPREAIQWLKRAADHADAENPHALHELGLLYEAVQPPDGSGVIIRDEAYAFSLFSQAAELGYKFSQFRLGCAYEYSLLGCPISPRDSIMWYSRAAVQEEHQSELALSGWYLTGSEGVLGQSDTEAYLWARKAAMAGLPKAEYAMGYFTEVGIGSPSDLEGAKRWYWRAAAQNFPKARERLEDLKRGGNKPQLKARERISRSKVGKQNEGECSVM